MAITFVILDIVLRAFWGFTPRSGILSPKAIASSLTRTTIVFQPGYAGTLTGLEFRVAIRSNSLGFRDREVNLNGIASERPYLFTGDSYFFGWGVDIGERVSEQFAELLKNEQSALNGPSLNFAFPGFGTFQYLDILKIYASRTRPRLIILGLFVGNDFIDDQHTLTALRDGGPSAAAPLIGYIGEEVFSLRSVLRTSPLINVFRYQLWELAWLRTIFNRMELRNDRLDIYRTDRAGLEYETTFSVLDKISTFCRAEGIPILIVIIPDHSQVLSKELFAEYEIGRPQRLLANYLTKLGIPYLDLLNHFNKAEKAQDLFFRQDKHWNSKGHAFVARVLAEYVLRNQALLPRPFEETAKSMNE